MSIEALATAAVDDGLDSTPGFPAVFVPMILFPDAAAFAEALGRGATLALALALATLITGAGVDSAAPAAGAF